MNIYMGNRLKVARRKAGFTQVELAELLDVSKGTVAMWEVDKRISRTETLLELSDLLNVSMDYLVRGHEYKEESSNE